MRSSLQKRLDLAGTPQLKVAGAAAMMAIALGALVVRRCAGGKASAAECTEMMDRYVDMSIQADPELAKLPPAAQADVREMKKALKKGERAYAQVQSQCEAEISRKEYRCAMDAPTPNDWEACIE